MKPYILDDKLNEYAATVCERLGLEPDESQLTGIKATLARFSISVVNEVTNNGFSLMKALHKKASK